MSNVNMEGLPPEMQQRIAGIIEKAKSQVPAATEQAAPAATPAPAPVQRPPSLMDHTIALRQEVMALRQELASQNEQVAAMGQVVEAVGQAVGQLYQMFCQQTATTDQSATYASQFQQQQVTEDDY